MVLFQGEPAKELAVVHDQDEMTALSTCPGQPPRAQEGRGEWGSIDQNVPLFRPLAELRDVYEPGRSHYG